MSTRDAVFHVQGTGGTGGTMRDGFPYFAHHDSVGALWTERWRASCAAGLDPFHDAEIEDFDPLFSALATRWGSDTSVFSAPDEWAAPFLPVAEVLMQRAEQAEGHDDAAARDLYLRAAAVYRIGRFPINRSPVTQRLWRSGVRAYVAGGRYLEPPNHAVELPFTRADPAAGDQAGPVPAFLRVPTGEPPPRGWPVLIFFCGLDAYRTDHTPRTQAHVDQGVATLSFEIPGTGDCPASASDPLAADRLLDSVIDWIDRSGPAAGLDPSTVLARGVSAGSYNAVRAAHTHASRLRAVVAQGVGCHLMFDAGWIRAQDQMEYPFALAGALAYKFGFREPDPSGSVEAYVAGARRFSLLDAGLLDRKSCRMLLVDGTEDSVFPIEDALLVARHQRHQDLVLRADRGHLGDPGAEEVVVRWIDGVLHDRD